MNPWTALMEPLRTRDNRARRDAPTNPGPSTFETSDGLRFKPAAALVVTPSRHDQPHVQLVPVIVMELR